MEAARDEMVELDEYGGIVEHIREQFHSSDLSPQQVEASVSLIQKRIQAIKRKLDGGADASVHADGMFYRETGASGSGSVFFYQFISLRFWTNHSLLLI